MPAKTDRIKKMKRLFKSLKYSSMALTYGRGSSRILVEITRDGIFLKVNKNRARSTVELLPNFFTVYTFQEFGYKDKIERSVYPDNVIEILKGHNYGDFIIEADKIIYTDGIMEGKVDMYD